MEIFLRRNKKKKKNPWKHPDKIQKKSKEKFQEKEDYWKTSWDISRKLRRSCWKVTPMIKCLKNIREVSKVKCEIPGKQVGTILEGQEKIPGKKN